MIEPTTGAPFGPGWFVSWQTDRIGPEPAGTRWVIRLEAPAGEDLMGLYDVPYQAAVQQDYFTQRINFTSDVIGVKQDWATGQPARLTVALVAPTGVPLEQQNVTVELERTQGQAYETVAAITSNPQVVNQGITEEEHNAILQTNVGVIAMAGINPLDMIGDLANAFAGSPPLGFGSLSTTYFLTGDGEMPDIGDLFHTKLGIYFIATVIPIGLSHRHGQSEEYPARLVQWRTVHTVGGLEMVTEVLDYDTHGELMKWRQAKPTRIEYSILPGVTIAARWWQFP